ncbi:MAG: APC family permease [Acidobacteriaceae bacterium]|nr:APC family permease [Acidobacteriaceae bacterium]MBV9766456.1 APC family permease [Acidobacteriaceae bacterium]
MDLKSGAKAAKVIVATTVALSFISYWRGAAIVLNDLASSMFYAGGIAEQAVGKSAAWYVLGVMLFSFAVRSVYMESCGMFVRGGVYVVVRDSMGPIVARLSVSSLVFDYILTGPISCVSAGQYLGRLINELFGFAHRNTHVDPNTFAAFFGVLVTLYFWRSNIKGLETSSTEALRIIQITTVMVLAILIWAPLTIVLQGKWQLPPAPVPHNLVLQKESLGWLKGTFWPTIPIVAVTIAFGHSLLSMSGFETLAQVYREIASPKLKNLKFTANIVCLYAIFSTGVITLLAAMIIPDAVRLTYVDNLIGGLAMNLVGPEILRLGFHVFVVIVGVLILSGAVNTSLIGANGVLNRVAEDGVLLQAFRKPHPKFGTTSRIINSITLLQLLTIILSRGDVYLLGEAYAFGVVWSFALKALGVLVLRFQRSDQEYKVPLNIHIGGKEIPIGLAVTTLVLLATAAVNLFTKEYATIYGVSFTIAFFLVFTISERINTRRHKERQEQSLERFNLQHQPSVDAKSLHARAGSVLVAVRNPENLHHLKRTLQRTDLRRNDIVVMTVRPLGTDSEYDLNEDQMFGSDEKTLFTAAVNIAEKEGKPVELLVVSAIDPFEAVVQTANQLKVSRLVTGVSPRMSSDELARRIGLAWEKLSEPRHPFSLEIISHGRPSTFVNLGPHPPRLWPEDVNKVHDLWLKLSSNDALGSKLHHRDVVKVALRRLEQTLSGEQRDEVLQELENELRNHR